MAAVAAKRGLDELCALVLPGRLSRRGLHRPALHQLSVRRGRMGLPLTLWPDFDSDK